MDSSGLACSPINKRSVYAFRAHITSLKRVKAGSTGTCSVSDSRQSHMNISAGSRGREDFMLLQYALSRSKHLFHIIQEESE